MHAVLKELPRTAAAALVAWSARHAWFVILLGLALTLLALRYTAGHIGIDTDTGEMIDRRLPHRQASFALDEAFPRLRGDVVLYAESAHAGDAEDAADQIAALLRDRADIARALSQPGGGEFFARQGLLYLDVDELWALDDRLAEAAPMLGTLAGDPSLRGLFDTMRTGLAEAGDDAARASLARLFDRVSGALERFEAGSREPTRWRDELFAREDAAGPARSVILIDPALADTSFQPAEPAIDALRALAAELEPSLPGVRLRITGSDPMNGEELVTVADDAWVTTTLSFVCVAIVLVWGLRSATLVCAVLVTLACGLVLTAAFAAMFVGNLNLISVCFAVLFIGMGVDFGIQFVLRYHEETRSADLRQTALVGTARGVGGALVLAAVGAAISFSAFVPTSYKGLAQLGIISSSSMAIALVANLTLLPALLRVLPVPRPVARRAPAGGTGAGFIERHWQPVLAASLLLAVASLFLLPGARFDLNPLNLKDPESPAVQAFRDLASEGSAYTIHVLADSLAAADESAGRLAALPLVDKAVTLSSYVPGDQEEKLGIIDGMRLSLGALMDSSPVATPSPTQERAAVEALAAALDERLANGSLEHPALDAAAARLAAALAVLRARADWPEAAIPAARALIVGDLPRTLARLRALLGAEAVDVSGLPDDIRQRYLSADGRARVEVFPREDLHDNGAMRAFAREVQAAEPRATGAPIELVAGSEAVIESCIQASLWALLVTLAMHIGVLRGVVDALLVSAPLVLAMLLTISTSVLFDFPFNFANIIALPLLIGLNNAYGAYLVVRRQHAQSIGQLLGSSTPRAVLVSGLTAIASFGTLGVSKHPGMAGMGILIALSLAYALLCALVMLPALMVALERRR